MNSIQSKKIKKYLKENRQSTDEMQQVMLDMFTMNQVTNMEAAALMVSVMRNLMNFPHNAEQLKALGIDASKLGVDGTAELIVMWAREYAKKQ